MVEYKLISTGSKGNAIIYENTILVDCGVSYKLLADEISDVKILLLTHDHADHVRIPVLKRLVRDLPNLVIMCGQWLEYATKGLETSRIVYCEFGKSYKVGNNIFSMVKAFHDTENCGWKIQIGDKKIFHMTDTYTLDGVSAKDYDLYVLEGNFDEETIQREIEEAYEKGEFTYKVGVPNSHLSFQKAYRFFYLNKKNDSELKIIHMSRQYEEENIYEKYIKDKLKFDK